MKFKRRSGILLHPTSLTSPYGIGDLGKDAFKFIDFLADCKQKLWQICPLGHTGYGDSPYQCYSAFAGNFMLISIDKIIKEGLLNASDIKLSVPFPENYVDYGSVHSFKLSCLKNAYINFRSLKKSPHKSKYDKFCSSNEWWLDDYALYMSLRDYHNFASWNQWEKDILKRETKAIKKWKEKLEEEILYYKFIQYLFFDQWSEVKSYANSKSVEIIGDIPIYVSYDSVDVWANPDLFYLDDLGKPTVVAGVPPDYFSSTGQLWGNPIYNWDIMKKNKYKWWIDRIKTTLEMVDIIRLDHFRGFEAYWEVDASEKTAINGKWIKGPAEDFFYSVEKQLGSLPFIAEDLGIITDEVDELRKEFNFPGMKILQFAFGEENHKYQPHRYEKESVVYTGTHDNDTSLGWFLSCPQYERDRALKYMNVDGSSFTRDFIKLALSSCSDTAIIPLQDILALGSEARFNTPGRAEGNWSWRYSENQINDEIKHWLTDLTVSTDRG